MVSLKTVMTAMNSDRINTYALYFVSAGEVPTQNLLSVGLGAVLCTQATDKPGRKHSRSRSY